VLTDTRDGGTNACDNRCAIDEICVAYFDGNCISAGNACRKVSSSCKESGSVQGASCWEGPCNEDICGLKDGPGSWYCNYTRCAGDTSRADAKCYGIGDVGGYWESALWRDWLPGRETSSRPAESGSEEIVAISSGVPWSTSARDRLGSGVLALPWLRGSRNLQRAKHSFVPLGFVRNTPSCGKASWGKCWAPT